VWHERCHSCRASNIREEEKEAVMKLDTVLVPLDGSPVAEAVLPFLRRIAGPLDLDVVLLEVVEPLAPEVLDGAYVSSEILEARFAEARRYVAACAAELTRAGSRVRTVIRRGLAPTEIVAAARAERADLIAMTTHGRSGLGKLLFGSVAERVLREADVPVLMMRLGDRAGREPGLAATAGGAR
jgi:nucleotide-binding universal stress UspA family protein